MNQRSGNEDLPDPSGADGEASRGELGRLAETMRSAIEGLRRPTLPLTEPWEASIGGLVRRSYDVPSVAAAALAQFDRLGALRLTPTHLGFDREDVAWDDIVEVRSNLVAEVLTDNALEREVERFRKMLPPLPGRKWALEKAAGAVGELARQALLRSGREGLIRSVVTEVDHRAGRFSRTRTMSGGLVVASLLGALPAVNQTIVVTAGAAGANVMSEP